MTDLSKTSVLIVDDSRLVRQILMDIIDSDPSLEVVGCAVDPFDAREKIKKFNPDVITLDIEMPRMDGITFLKNLMRLRPTRVVMISTLTEKGADITLEALESGAIDFVEKPKSGHPERFDAQAEEIVEKVKNAATANILPLEQQALTSQSAGFTTTQSIEHCHRNTKIDLIAIGASTGGTEATNLILSSLPGDMPPMVIAQHMPSGFTASYAERLNRSCDLTVCEFNQRTELLLDGHVYLAHGGFHMSVVKKAGRYYARRIDTAPVNRHKPSVDVLFSSVAKVVGRRAIGAILTGMGVDGASSLGEMQSAGAATIAQDEESSVIWGMPGSAVERGSASQILPLNDIGKELTKLCYQRQSGN